MAGGIWESDCKKIYLVVSFPEKKKKIQEKSESHSCGSFKVLDTTFET